MAVADAPGAEVQGVRHRVRPGAVPRVAGEGEAQLAGPLEEGREVFEGHDALRPRKVDAHDPLPEILRRHLHGLGVLLPVGGLRPHAHHAEQDADVDARPGLAALAAALQDGLHRLALGHPLPGVELGGEADLGVGRSPVGQVADELPGHPAQGLRVLHHLQRQLKAL